IQTIMSFARAVDAKDNYTKSHSENVAVLSWHIGNKLGFDNDKKHILYYSALLHDIGKIGVPDYILAKPGKLTDLEYEIIKKHTTIGGRILKDIDIMPQLSDVAMSHHERYDGKGYPHGKKGEEISLFSRIVCIADSVDAMISERSYKPSMPLQSALKEVEAQS
ncbi:MAG: HD-GYP domain-containing protein, partial [Oscillospiraceae bacterium]